MATLAQDVAEFLRDAQYRFAEISYDITNRRNRKISNLAELRSLRKELMVFLNLLYMERHVFYNGAYNFTNWTEDQIRERMTYFRDTLNMNIIADSYFVGHTPNLYVKVENLGGTENDDIATGSVGQMAVYTGANTLGGQDIPDSYGHTDAPITTYFD